jgi:hypothetical protein
LFYFIALLPIYWKTFHFSTHKKLPNRRGLAVFLYQFSSAVLYFSFFWTGT